MWFEVSFLGVVVMVVLVGCCRVFNQYPGGKCVYIAPLKALVRERIKDWRIRFQQKLGKK